MNIRTRTILMTAAITAAAASLTATAADQHAFFEQQRQITDGYHPQYAVRERAAAKKPATPRQIAENRWLELERARGSGNVKPVPFPPPPETAFASMSPPETAKGG